ncbi:MAG: DUF3313 family protein [Myxococcota bacterium]
MLALAWLVISCGSAAPRTVRYETRSQLAASTPDGLRRIADSALGGAYVRPGADLSGYRRVILRPTEIAPGEPPAPDASAGRGTEESEETKIDRMTRIVDEAVAGEFARSSAYAVGQDAGPGALLVQPAVLDFVLDTRQLPGGEWSLGGRVGEMTLVLDVRDAATGQPLARFVERPDLRLQTGTGGVTVQGPGPVWSLVHRAAVRWAQLSREELDALHQATIPPLPDPG